MNNVTAIIVSYNTRDLLKACIESIRRFYPTLKIIVIDGSPPDSDCWQYVGGLEDNYTKVRLLEHNAGHGPGMVKGIELCETDYFLLCDSDVTINKPTVIEQPMSWLTDERFGHEFYGCGKMIHINRFGSNIPDPPPIISNVVLWSPNDKDIIPYLHPHFAIINKDAYNLYDPIINHGAPMIKAMQSVKKNGPHRFLNFDWGDTITHHGRGTRALNPKEFNPANWDKV